MPVSPDFPTRSLYDRLLNLSPPWSVAAVVLDEEAQHIEVRVRCDPQAPLRCPQCGAAATRHGHVRPRRWRDLDTHRYPTHVRATVPRVWCREHGARQLRVPWAEPGARHTRAFEAEVIDLLLDGLSVQAAARKLKLHWRTVSRIQGRAVARGLRRRTRRPERRLCVDEVAHRRRHQYTTVVSGMDSKVVLWAADSRREEALGAYFRGLSPPERAGVDTVSMDMWPAYIKAARRWLPDSEEKICFDWFHVVQHLNRAIDRIRRKEQKRLLLTGVSVLTGSRYLLLQALESHADWSESRRRRFAQLRQAARQTAAAWELKELARALRGERARAAARDAWNRWLEAVENSGLPEMIKVGRTIRAHLRGIINALVKQVSNARAESINAKLQRIKRNACGFRSWKRFRMAIFFHCGGLDLYPDPA